MIGTRLAHFEITAKLGEGGMGEVYRATDTRLNREVAVKVLPAAFTEDAERLARFEREAQLLAQLHHPHIASIFGLEEGEGVQGLVMELVEGETLAERLERGAVPLDEALELARQIAEALEEAHGKGIVHRDLKPQNVKITPAGTVKVLDFGLAKALDPGAGGSGSSPELSHSPTMTLGATVQGVILGTAAYMAPEQAKGQAVDKRADIWAFGVILYEMLTGRRLFAGDSVPDILAGVLKSEIDLGRLPPETPPAIRRLVGRCLARDPRNRLHDIADARLVLQDVLAGEVYRKEADSIRSLAIPARGRPWSWMLALVGVVLAAGSVGYLLRPSEATTDRPLKLAVQLPPHQEIVVGGNALLTFSPDGESLLFAGRENGRQMIYRRRLDERQAVPIPGTDNGEAAFFSPDGRSIGFIAGGQLMKVPAEGGRAFRFAEALGAGGATWLSDGTIVFAPIYSDGLFRVPAEGGARERLTSPNRDDEELGHWWPQPLPGERLILFTAFRTPVDRSRVGLLDLETGEIRWLVEGGYFGRYSPTGHLLYAKGRALYAMPFDAAEGAPTGTARAVLDDLYISQTSGYATVDVSSHGVLAYVTETAGSPPSQLVWIDREGHATVAAEPQERYLSVSLAPGDRQAALTIQGETLDLWTYSFERGTLSRLTSGEDTEFDPVWSADGREIFYVVDQPPFTLYRITVGAPDSGRPIWNEAAQFDTTSIAVSPDREELVFSMTEADTGASLYARDLEGTEPRRAVAVTRAGARYPSFSPDGRRMAYMSNETGRFEVYVQEIRGSGQRIQISAEGGKEPLWAESGEIFYRRGDELWVVPTRGGDLFEFDAPRLLFRHDFVSDPDTILRSFDVTADGSRALAITVPEARRPRQIDIVTDWALELARLDSGGL